MANENTTNDANESNAKAKTVAEDMAARKLFDSVDDARVYIEKAADQYADFNDVPKATVGIGYDEDAEQLTFDSEIYGDNTRVMVSVLKNRGEIVNGKRQPSTVKAIVIVPAPTAESIIAEGAAGADWVQRIIDKELNHVAVRVLRDAEDVNDETVLAQMPQSITDYISSTRSMGGGIMEAFNEYYKTINATIADASPAWARRRLTKAELKKAMSSAAYASEFYPELEDRGEKESLFVIASNMGVHAAKKNGMDSAIFERWLATRNETTLSTSEGEEEVDEDSLMASMFGDDEGDDADETDTTDSE